MDNNMVTAKGRGVERSGTGYLSQIVMDRDLTWGGEHTTECRDGML